MSGGSFNYLFLKRGADLMAAVEDIHAMRKTLVGMDPRRGLPEAIRDLDELIRLADVDSPANAIADRLEGVMRAVERWQSSDVSEDDVTAALAALRANERPAFRDGAAFYAAAEDLRAGDAVTLGADGKVRRASSANTRAPTDEEIARAKERARREDGTVDAFAFAVELADITNDGAA